MEGKLLLLHLPKMLTITFLLPLYFLHFPFHVSTTALPSADGQLNAFNYVSNSTFNSFTDIQIMTNNSFTTKDVISKFFELKLIIHMVLTVPLYPYAHLPL